jgi:predicted DNA-binding transcriptional regulator AlpA
MADRPEPALALVPGDADSHGAGGKPSRKVAPFDEAALLARTLWTVPETAFICRVAVRTVWRELSDPDSTFPRPRRMRGRTLLARDGVLAWLEATAR